MRTKELRKAPPQALENAVLQWWEEASIFQRSIDEREGCPTFSFYEGPPTANGRPGIHHVLARTIKDIFCRYKTMKGFRVERKAGWDTHGLPVEIEVEKALGLDGREDILNYGMDRFNAACRESVLEYKGEWDALTRRMGYWVDLDNPYVTFNNSYVETVWWLLKQMFDRGLLYRGHKIQWYSPGSGTVLSSHEVSLGYCEVQDPSAYVLFAVCCLPDTYFLAWTTTPWTLVSNAALAVGSDIPYVEVSVGDRKLILAAARLEVLRNDYVVERHFNGRELAGRRYVPLFDWFDQPDAEAWRVVCADFVSTDDGTGIVHLAPAFGADDFAVSKEQGLPVLNPINEHGVFTDQVPLVQNLWFKKADRPILRNLMQRGLLYREESCVHNYPHDWRKGTPLMSYPVESWFVRTTAIRQSLMDLNTTINWQPPAIGEGRFGEWLSNNVDWALSRRRFWGTPLPVWLSDSDNSYAECIGSIAELRAKTGKELKDIDLHRPYVDKLTWPAPDGGTMRRVPETIDVWFDSGAMPFAQWHYPFENKEAFETSFPADFIAEGVDQTRGWFYTLHAIAALVRGEPAYRNCVVTGLVLDDKGEKMSKTKENVVDPFKVIEKFGADRVRWYLMGNSVPWEDLRFSEQGIAEVDRKFFGTLSNVFRFFATYAAIDGYLPDKTPAPLEERPELDRWILSRLQTTIRKVDAAFEAYHPTRAARSIENFVDDLSNWYLRRSRRRFWSSKTKEKGRDKWSAYHTVDVALQAVSRMMAPIAPFFAEWLYRELTDGPASVHLARFPDILEDAVDEDLEHRMKIARTVSSTARSLRSQAGINIRQPLARLLVVTGADLTPEVVELVATVIQSEVNVKALEYIEDSSAVVKHSVKPNYRRLGKRLGKDMKRVASAISLLDATSAARYHVDRKLTVKVNGDVFELGPTDLDVRVDGVEGWIVGQSEGITVALDTRLTHELISEGLARECINRIQSQRKLAGYEVTDRILVYYDATDDMAQAMEKHAAWIRNETLAHALTRDDNPAGDAVASFDVGGETFTVGLLRVEDARI